MSFNRKAAIAAGVATMCIITGTAALAASSDTQPKAHYVIVVRAQ